MQRISNRHHDVEHLLFAERLAANAGNGLDSERLEPADGSPDVDSASAVDDDPGSHAGPTSPDGWY